MDTKGINLMSATTVNISFQKELLADIDRVAKKEARSRSELLREATRMYLDRKKRWDHIFSFGQKQAAQQGLTPADVNKAIKAVRARKNR
ncbi:MAG TPA: ribbon-helix-helix protein, CopG family [Tichowtungia sp.]|nr:ribbon-helix-helix protein, CopG family [Tichowtungia sp.]